MEPTHSNDSALSTGRFDAGLPTTALKVTVLASLFLFYFPFVVKHYLYNYEPDTSVFNEFVKHYLDFFSSFNIRELPAPSTWPPYFDGQYWSIRSLRALSTSALVSPNLSEQLFLHSTPASILPSAGPIISVSWVPDISSFYRH